MTARRPERGTVLIVALWTLTLLAVMGVQLAARVRQKIDLTGRIEQRLHALRVAEAGVHWAQNVVTDKEFNAPKAEMTPVAKKLFWLNNPQLFQNQPLGEDVFNVAYVDRLSGQIVYGVLDETRKLNLNHATKMQLQRLVTTVLQIEDEEEAKDLAAAIYDWRMYGDSEIEGFFSDEYYESLKYPYEEKKTDYEVVDELRVVRGITPERYEALSPFLTVYGDGRVNINTAPGDVLFALGMGDALVAKFLEARRGKDGLDLTEDDVVFETTNIAGEIGRYAELTGDDTEDLQQGMGGARMRTDPGAIEIVSRGRLRRNDLSRTIRCVLDLSTQRLERWEEPNTNEWLAF